MSNSVLNGKNLKKPVYIFALSEFNFHLVNVGGIQSFLVQFQALKLCKEIFNAANIYRMGIKLTKSKYIDRSLRTQFKIKDIELQQEHIIT